MTRRFNPVSLFQPLSAAAALVVVTGCGDPSSEAPKEKSEAKSEAVVETQANGAPAPRASTPAVDRPGEPGSDERAEAFAAEAGGRVAEKPNVPGDDPAWFFLVRELRQLGHGKFWEQDWGTIAQNQTDPLPSMAEFHEMLKAKGVDLIVVPVPAKGSIYPDKLAAGFAPGDVAALTPFVEKLREQGLNVIDLEPLMLQRRDENPGDKLWCEQDAHYTPLSCEIIAGLVKNELEGKDWFGDQAKEKIVRTEPMELKITGDQVAGSEWEGKVPQETLAIRYAGRDSAGDGGNLEPVEADQESPVLLMGDSHTLVFQEGASGGMHCKGAGLLDQLAFELQFVPDHVGVRGSGLMQARKQLFFQRGAAVPGYWDNKKAVIWVFSVREFTQSTDRIQTVPIERP